MRKLFFFAYAKIKVQISCTVTMQLISAFVFARDMALMFDIVLSLRGYHTCSFYFIYIDQNGFLS